MRCISSINQSILHSSGKSAYLNRYGKSKLLKKNSYIKIQTGGASYPWFVYGQGVNEYVYPHTTNWFKVIR